MVNKIKVNTTLVQNSHWCKNGKAPIGAKIVFKRINRKINNKKKIWSLGLLQVLIQYMLHNIGQLIYYSINTVFPVFTNVNFSGTM